MNKEKARMQIIAWGEGLQMQKSIQDLNAKIILLKRRTTAQLSIFIIFHISVPPISLQRGTLILANVLKAIDHYPKFYFQSKKYRIQKITLTTLAEATFSA